MCMQSYHPRTPLTTTSWKTLFLSVITLQRTGFKRKFRSYKPDTCETFLQFAVRLESYFLRWIDMSKIDQSFKGLADFILRDKFIHVCDRDLTLFIKERTPKSMEGVATLADQFREARFTNAASLVTKSGPKQTPGPKRQGQALRSKPKPEVVKPIENSKFVPKSERRCYKCNQIGHIASECRPKHKVGCVVSESADSDNQETCSEETFMKGCSAFISPLYSVVNSQASSSVPHVRLTSSCQSNVIQLCQFHLVS